MFECKQGICAAAPGPGAEWDPGSDLSSPTVTEYPGAFSSVVRAAGTSAKARHDRQFPSFRFQQKIQADVLEGERPEIHDTASTSERAPGQLWCRETQGWRWSALRGRG